MIPRRRSPRARVREVAGNVWHVLRQLKHMSPTRLSAWVDSSLVNWHVRREIRNKQKLVGGFRHLGFTGDRSREMVSELKDHLAGEHFDDFRDPLLSGFQWGGSNAAAMKRAWRERHAIANQHLDHREQAQRQGHTVKLIIGRDGKPKYRWRKIKG